jgi:hypothetical protein
MRSNTSSSRRLLDVLLPLTIGTATTIDRVGRHRLRANFVTQPRSLFLCSTLNGRLRVYRKAGLEHRETLVQFGQLLFWQMVRTSSCHAACADKKKLVNIRVWCRARYVDKGAKQPQAHRRIGKSIMPNLLEGRIEYAGKAYPLHSETEYVWRCMIMGLWRRAANPENCNPAELIDTANSGAGIIDGGRQCAKCDIHDLNDTKLNILLQRAGGTDVESGKK